jgi:hypothetical protein
MPKSLQRLVVSLVAAALLLTSTTDPARAADLDTGLDIQHLVDAYLANHPGGRQINATEIAYGDGDGDFIVTVVRPVGTLAGPDCPSGWFCFYEYTFYRYPRGKLSDCGLQDLREWSWRNRTESVHYNMSSGSVTFIDENGPTALFWVGTSKRTIGDVGVYRNRADFVYRSCG